MSKISLYQGAPTTSAASVKTSGKDGTIDAFAIHNTDGVTATTVEGWLDVTGAAGAVDATKVFSVSVSSGATETGPMVNQAFPKGAKIYLKADPATATVTISGRE